MSIDCNVSTNSIWINIVIIETKILYRMRRIQQIIFFRIDNLKIAFVCTNWIQSWMIDAISLSLSLSTPLYLYASLSLLPFGSLHINLWVSFTDATIESQYLAYSIGRCFQAKRSRIYNWIPLKWNRSNRCDIRVLFPFFFFSIHFFTPIKLFMCGMVAINRLLPTSKRHKLIEFVPLKLARIEWRGPIGI